MTLDQLNVLDEKELYKAFEKCCGSSQWVMGMMNARPFTSKHNLLREADLIWEVCQVVDGLEAFEHHPRIGDRSKLEEKFASTKEWASNEQSGVDKAPANIIDQLAKANEEYFDKFGYIFIVCATGKSAQEMLNIILKRIPNDADKEIKIAMAEQHKITKLRLEKLLV